MRRHLIGAFMASALLAGCSFDETVEQEHNARIGFEKAFVENSTKAEGAGGAADVRDPSISLSGMFDYGVYGYRIDQDAYTEIENRISEATTDSGIDFDLLDGLDEVPGVDLVFDNERVRSDGYYANTRNWEENNYYIFMAAAPHNGGWSVNETINSQLGYGTDFLSMFVQSLAGREFLLSFQNEDGTKDFSLAVPKLETTFGSYPQSVSINFFHTLSKIRFTVINNFQSDEYTIKVSDIRIRNAYGAGLLVASNISSASTGDYFRWLPVSDWMEVLLQSMGATFEMLGINPAKKEIVFGNAVANDAETNKACLIAKNGSAGSYYNRMLIPTSAFAAGDEALPLINETPNAMSSYLGMDIKALGNFTVSFTAQVFDSNGNPLADEDGNPYAAEEFSSTAKNIALEAGCSHNLIVRLKEGSFECLGGSGFINFIDEVSGWDENEMTIE